MSKTQEAVKRFLETVNMRKSKVMEKVKELTEKDAKVRSEIKMLTKRLIELDLRNDTDGQSEINKKLASLRSEQNELQDKILAYQEITTDTSVNRKEIEEILDIARDEAKCRHAEIVRKRELKSSHEKQLEQIRSQVDDLSNEVSRLEGQTEAKTLLPILPYIESRKVKHYSQESLINAVLSGVTGELYEQYIENP